MVMRTLVVLVVCMAIVSGCSPKEKATKTAGSEVSPAQFAAEPTSGAAPREGREILEINEVDVSEESLRLNYQVNNIFSHDIWVCASIGGPSRPDCRGRVETRIADATLQIRLLGNLERNVHVDGSIYATYYRLLPGQSRVDTLLLDVPVGNSSTVYYVELPFEHKIPMLVTQVTFELGYFTDDLAELLLHSEERGWTLHESSRWALKTGDPNLVFVPYVPYSWAGMGLEHSVQVSIPGVRVPAQVVSDGIIERLQRAH